MSHKYLGDPVRMQVLIQQVWEGAQILHFFLKSFLLNYS